MSLFQLKEMMMPLQISSNYFDDKVIEQKISALPLNFFEISAINYAVMHIDYQICQTHLWSKLNQSSSEESISVNSEQELIDLINLVILISESQQIIYRDYLQAPQEAARCARDRDLLSHMLLQLTEKRIQPYPSPNNLPYQSKWLRDKTRDLNPIRLIFVRGWRFFMLMMMAWGPAALKDIINTMDMNLALIIAHQAWIFFAPRLLVNVFIILKHTFFPKGKEAELLMLTRLAVQFDRRWSELANDFLWLTTGLLTGFVLARNWFAYCTCVLQCCQLLCAIIRAVTDIHRITVIRHYYEQKTQLSMQNDQSNSVYKGYTTCIDQYMRYIMFARMIDILEKALLVLGSVLLLPPLAFAYWIPIVGAGIMITVTLFPLFVVPYVERMNPIKTVDQCTKCSFFKFAEHHGVINIPNDHATECLSNDGLKA